MQYIGMLGNIDVGGLVFLLVGGLLVFGFIWYRRATKRADAKEQIELQNAALKTEKLLIKEAKKAGVKRENSILGTGDYNCLCIRQGNIIDWTKIPKPIGEMYLADTSCPVSGGIYIVKEEKDGSIVDYDPRKEPINVEETPEYAWFATHWEIVKRVWSAPINPWGSISTYAAIILGIGTFLFGMIALGG